jgi:hypothetical protein
MGERGVWWVRARATIIHDYRLFAGHAVAADRVVDLWLS